MANTKGIERSVTANSLWSIIPLLLFNLLFYQPLRKAESPLPILTTSAKSQQLHEHVLRILLTDDDTIIIDGQFVSVNALPKIINDFVSQPKPGCKSCLIHEEYQKRESTIILEASPKTSDGLYTTVKNEITKSYEKLMHLLI
ncbi:hypothetical protein [Mangrovimonas aestuarii]|uniref:hypothetical protein n=1 Tax=Mangrovimonas aestuarii TaxID=3018443 RepID=UPI002378F44C|nr:hypothetical protein [Mangrovimonas aestuarii]